MRNPTATQLIRESPSWSAGVGHRRDTPQLQHNMWVLAAMSAVFSVITRGGKRVEIQPHADPLYRHIIVTAEWKFWGCVESGEPPCPFGVDPPKARIEVIVSDEFFRCPAGVAEPP